MASYDALTGIMNRRAFLETVHETFFADALDADGLSLLLLDIDHFKNINDGFGHAAGDEVLARVGACLQQEVASVGVAARWGGEEFVVALPTRAAEIAAEFGERIRFALETEDVRAATGDAIAVTASIGLAVARDGESLLGVIERADQAMYKAKVSGRNRLCIAPEQATESEAA